jgi:hypothetical protein
MYNPKYTKIQQFIVIYNKHTIVFFYLFMDSIQLFFVEAHLYDCILQGSSANHCWVKFWNHKFVYNISMQIV